jgi:hypothetical protein
MKNKIIQLFDNKNIKQNSGVKYSTLLEQFIEPFALEFTDLEYYDDIFEFAMNAWNFGNMKLILPESESDTIINAVKNEDINSDLLIRMINHKISHFSEFTNFIVDFEIEETSSDPVLSVITQPQDVYLSEMFEKLESENTQDDFEENYIDRYAIIIKPLQPYIDWCSSIYTDDIEGVAETRTYLISEDIDDVETWLKKKFDKIFEIELESWYNNKKKWPQNRNYKMFNQWFQVDISKTNYDLERKPIVKYE